MCFSAEASFATSAALLTAGAYCIQRATTGATKGYLPLSAVPALFGAQQFFEGLVWLGLERGDADLTRVGALSFLLFAIVFWPSWIPFSSMFLEKRKRIRVGLSLVAFAALGFGLIVYIPPAAHARDWLHVGLLHHSIRYEFEMAAAFRALPRTFWQLGYVAVVITPLIVTGDRKFRIFGALLLTSAVVSQAVFWYAFISVWCAFSALLSAWLCYMLAVRPPGMVRTPSVGSPRRSAG